MKRLFIIALIFLVAPTVLQAQESTRGILNAASTDCSTTGSCLSLSMNANNGGGAVQIVGTYSATLQFESTSDGGTWVAITGTPVGTGAAGATSTTSTGAWQFSTTGMIGLRVRVSAYTSGAAGVSIQPSLGTVGGTAVIGTFPDNEPFNVAQWGGTAVVTCTTTGCAVVAPGVVTGVTPTGLTSGAYRNFAMDGSGGARITVSNAINGYLSVVSATSAITVGAAPTDVALVTVGATQRIIVHEVSVKCSAAVTNAITLSIGLAAANIPASGAGLIEKVTTTASAANFPPKRGSGFPGILAVGAAGEDLRVTSTAPAAGECPVSYVYTVEGA